MTNNSHLNFSEQHPGNSLTRLAMSLEMDALETVIPLHCVWRIR